MESLDDIFKPDGRLSECALRYEARDGQIEMAKAVAVALSSGKDTEFRGENAKTLVVEAETGIGKTLAYLIPAVLSGKRVVVSTATLNLQDQIVGKDIPLVAKIVGQDIPAVCLKGRQNYLCLYRWYQYRSNPQYLLHNDPWLDKIDVWLQQTATGDRAELDWLSEKSGLWPKISCQSNQCLGGDCPESPDCFINGLRRQAGNARLIIVNHHLFFSDLALKKGGFGDLLPRYEAVVFDEAHHLENTATAFFSKSFSGYQLLDLLADIERQAESDLSPETHDDLLALTGGLLQRLEMFAGIFPGPIGRYHLDTLFNAMTREKWIEEVELLSTGITRLIDRLTSCEAYGEGWHHLAKRAGELNDNFRDIAFFFDHNGREYVYWYEKRERTVTISATPLSVAGELQNCLYGSAAACVLTSATLTSGGSFAYIKERLGLSDEAEFLQIKSPFDYPRQTLLYVPEHGFPDPSEVAFSESVCKRVAEIINLSDGRALILCTSFKGMDALAAYLAEAVDFPLLVQGTASRNSLLHSFREETHSVLLAVASFWEGVDVVGESLSCVIIDKLPFEVPSDPVIQARIGSIKEQGGKPFFEFQVPRAILALRQGVGRLMRSATDRGVIAIMDTRLFSKGYGRTFLGSLPASPVTRNLSDIEQFYGKHN